jgi:outer membrane protein assembly factor BamB
MNDYLFSITKKNLLIALNLKNGKIIYSSDINEQISQFLKIKKKEVLFKNMVIANNKILIFLKNSYVLKFNIRGKLEKVNKLPTKINTYPIFINGSLIYLDFKNRVSLVD